MKTSIIIPAAGRPVAIKGAIRSLLSIAPERYQAEIIVVDNNTVSDLAEDLGAYCATLEGRVRYIRELSPGLGAARHRGAAEALGEQLTFIDDDVEVSDTWLPAIQRGFSDPNVAMVGGPSIPKFTSSVPSWFWSFLAPTAYGGWMCGWLSLLDIGRDVQKVDPGCIWGLNFSIRKDVMYACHGFHPDLVPKSLQRWQGDGETGLVSKVRAAGYRADYLQDALLLHLCGPDRLNVDYFQSRAYYQGVCDSYTHVRAGQAPSTQGRRAGTTAVYRQMWGFARNTMKRLRDRISLFGADGTPVRALTDQAQLDGWMFHQREVAADPRLLAWVRRENYLDADIRNEML